MKIFGTILASFLISLLIAESALRFSPEIRKRKKEGEWLRSLMTYDSLLGWKNLPRAEARQETSEFKVNYRTNSSRFRDRERSYSRNRGFFRILSLGDSITFGSSVDRDQRFTDLLEEKLRNIEVINLGVQGYGLDQELLLLQEEGANYQPDLILLYLIPDDLTRACYSKMWDRPKPHFIVTEKNELSLANVPVPKTDFFSFKNPVSDHLRHLLARRSYLFWLLQDKLYSRKASTLAAVSREESKEVLAELLFSEMKKTAEAVKAPLLIIGECPGQLIDFLTKKGIYYAPDPLTSYAGPSSDIFYSDRHPNPRGHKILAEGIYGTLKKKGLIPARHLRR